MYIDIHRHSADKGNADIVLRNIFHSDIQEVENQPYCSVGLHPWHLNEKSLYADLENVRLAAQNQEVLAIGEAGLDKSRETPFSVQEEAFMEQLLLAKQYNKPMVIHCVRSYSEISQIRRDSKHVQPWIFHWYNASTQMGLDLVSKGCYLSFGHMLFYETSKAYKAFRNIPVENIFFETDDADWTIRQVYQKAAELKEMELEELQVQVKRNFERVFKLKL